MAKLSEWFDQIFRFPDSIPNDSYIKNSIALTLLNDNGDKVTVNERIDVSANGGDFNPRRNSIDNYFIKNLKFNQDTGRKTADGSIIYIDSIAITESMKSEANTKQDISAEQEHEPQRMKI